MSKVQETTTYSWFNTNNRHHQLYLVATAIASKPFVFNEIDKIYNNNLSLYVAKTFPYSLENSTQAFPYKKIRALEQMLNILIAEDEMKEFKNTINIIKKSFKHVWNHCKIYNHFALNKWLENDNKRTRPNMNFVDLTNDLIIAQFLMDEEFEQSNISPQSFSIVSTFFEEIESRIDEKLELLTEPIRDRFQKEIGNVKGLIPELYGDSLILHRILNELRKTETVFEAFYGFRAYYENEACKYAKKEIEINEDDLLDTLSSFDTPSKAANAFESYAKYLEKRAILKINKTKEYLENVPEINATMHIENSMELLGVNFFEYMRLLKLNNNDLNIISYYLGFFKANYGFNDQSLYILLMHVLAIVGLKKDYSLLMNDTSSKKISSLSKELVVSEDEKSILAAQLQKQKSENIEIQKKLDLVKEENARLEKVIKQREQQQEDLEDLENELQTLRQYMQMQACAEEISKVDIDTCIKTLNKKRIVIIGGFHKWHQKLKKVLPNIKILHVDELHRDYSIIRSCEYVFAFSNYANHSSREKYKKYLKFEKDKLRYLSKVVNIKNTIQEMHHLITNQD